MHIYLWKIVAAAFVLFFKCLKVLGWRIFLLFLKKANNVTSTCVNCFWYFIWLINFFLWGKWLDIKVFVCLFGGFFFGFAFKISPFSKAIRNEMRWTQPIVVFNAFRKVSYIWNDPPSMKPPPNPNPHPPMHSLDASIWRSERKTQLIDCDCYKQVS